MKQMHNYGAVIFSDYYRNIIYVKIWHLFCIDVEREAINASIKIIKEEVIPMNFLNQLFSPTGVLAPFRNAFYREAQFMITDLIAKMFKMFLMAIFIGFILSFVLMVLIYFVTRQPVNELYGPTEMPKLRSNSMMNTPISMMQPTVINADYTRIERTSNGNDLLENVYFFRDGDDLTEICSRFNVSEGFVREKNQLTAWHPITPGTLLNIPLN